MSKYAKRYPSLSLYYSKDKNYNFEVIAETLETYFSDLFNLDSLEHEVRTNGYPSGSYARFFHACMTELNAKYTLEEVLVALHQALNTSETVKETIDEKLVFVPSVGGRASTQIGYLEKLATQTNLRNGEPLTYVDMLRTISGFKKAQELLQDKKTPINVSVAHLADLAFLKDLTSTNHTYLVNVNSQLDSPAKWATVIIDTTTTPTLFCETPLTESEKLAIETRFGPTIHYEGGKANHLPSTGYSALAWLDNKINKDLPWDLDGDFPALLTSFLFTQFAGDDPGKAYRYDEKEYTRFCTPAFRYFSSTALDTANSPGRWVGGKTCATILSAILPQGELGATSYDHNDIAQAMEKIHTLQLTQTGLGGYKNKAMQSLMTVLVETLQSDIKTIQYISMTNSEASGTTRGRKQTVIPGSTGTLHQVRTQPALKVIPGSDTITLTIPDQGHFYETEFFDLFNITSRAFSLNPEWIQSVYTARESLYSSSSYQFTASLMLLNTVRRKSKKPHIKISMPEDVRLIPDDLEQFIKILSDNVYVTKLEIGEHPQLKAAHKRLKSTLARNDWLHRCGYLPPLIDDYWFQAAKYWLFHLPDQPALLSTGVDEAFKHSVHDMGVDGLKAVLRFLTDTHQQDMLSAMYAHNNPVFYAACDAEELNTYLTQLSAHLSDGRFFPFSELGLAYDGNHVNKFIELLSASQSSPALEKITLMNSVAGNISVEFLKNLLSIATEKKWTVLIHIPDLEEKSTLSRANLGLRAAYIRLNNQILLNRHAAEKQALKGLENIQRVLPVAAATQEEDSAPAHKSVTLPTKMNIPNQTWPLKKSAGIQQQQEQEQEQQQQQQIEQVVEIQQEQEITLPHVAEEPVVGELIHYDNIDTHTELDKFYQEYIKNHPLDAKYAPLKVGGETDLQGFFHTWVSKNPQTRAPEALQQITLDAAKALLINHKKFASGIQVDNLPKGFYTQRSKAGDLILCYNPSYMQQSKHPLTLDLSIQIPKAEAWKGDFRLFTSGAVAKTMNAENWKKIILFARLQPSKDHADDYQEFLKNHPDIEAKLNKNATNIKKHWPMFIQLWHWKGNAGIDFFNIQNDFKIDFNAACHLLCAKTDSAVFMQQLIDGMPNQQAKKDYLKRIGQIYYRFGSDGMELFINQMKKLHDIHPVFFKAFNQSVLSESDDFSVYMTEKFFRATNGMCKALTNPETRALWQAVYTNHHLASGWDDIATLWNGFDYFTNEIKAMQPTLSAEKLKDISPQNMFVCMDRILACLKQLPEDQRQEFLDNIDQFDLTHGGIYYAIVHEGFRYFDTKLALNDFKYGDPTYAPDLKNIYAWTTDIDIKIYRTLAMQAKFNREAYHAVTAYFEGITEQKQAKLLWLVYLNYPIADIQQTLAKIEALDADFLEFIAKHIHAAIHQHKNVRLDVHLDALLALHAFCKKSTVNQVKLDELFKKSSYAASGALLESLSILLQMKQLTDQTIEKQLALFSSTTIQHPNTGKCPHDLVCNVYKMATLFGQSEAGINALYKQMGAMPPVVQQELRTLFVHLLSIEYEASELGNLNSSWPELVECVNAMQKRPVTAADIRIQFIATLESKSIAFKYSKTGDIRALVDEDKTSQLRLSDFPDHDEPLWRFMRDHLAIRTDKSVISQLSPIIAILKHIQRNRSLINEIDPLLSVLAKVKPGHRWLASNFADILRMIQPKDEETNYPISLLEVMLAEEFIGARPIQSIQRDFPTQLREPMQRILKSSTFNRQQQSMLCQILLRELHWQDEDTLFEQVIETLSLPKYTEARDSVLHSLTKADSIKQLKKQFENCFWLLDHAKNSLNEVKDTWSKTAAIWLQALGEKHQAMVQPLLTDIQYDFIKDPEKQALILHILAWSSLSSGYKSPEMYAHELRIKTPKLIKKFSQMSTDDLQKLARLYPQQPSPSADELRRLIKQSETSNKSLEECLERYNRSPLPEPRPDYGMVAATRDVDFQRMLAETQISSGEKKVKLSADDVLKISAILTRLKRIEHGDIVIENTNKPVSQLNQRELAAAFKRLSKEVLSDNERAQLWAVLFEVLARTTGKYPHLAQQFALISNDISIDAPSRVLQLATGEGKSHFVALRAARHAGMGKVVDICTAKRALAERDIEDYQNLFSYLDIKSAYITPTSSHDTYSSSQIHYSTTGDLSLFLDNQCCLGTPITVSRQNRVGLFDEFDFIRFDEGRKTEYNYALPTGLSPKQMTWFYQQMNAFYAGHNFEMHKGSKVIKPTNITALLNTLAEKAGDDEEKHRLISLLLKEPSQCVEWLQSACEANALEPGINYTVRNASIKIGGGFYPMREIIPLSSDNQKMAGSTFSAGVHQLLAVRLNADAKKAGQAQNYHIQPESQIISSQIAAQRMRELWGSWEGFTGTVSIAQSAMLYEEADTQILHVPTNQRDLRLWHPPAFYTDSATDTAQEQRFVALVEQVKKCLDKKQSILFSCKNDKQVAEIENELKKRLDKDMYAQLIFYTNEDPRAANDVLDDKKQQERWVAGKKQQGIGLVASGFGRGDNVGVEAVFLFDVNDTNDQFQKGGRTARNGQEGEVFQFYLAAELQTEKKQLEKSLKALGVNLDEINRVTGQDADEQCFNQVMLLRECASNLQNRAHDAYHDALAQFSSWGMGHLGGMNEAMRPNAAVQLNRLMSDIATTWIDISGGKKKEDDKIKSICDKISLCAHDFQQIYPDSSAFRLQAFTAPIKRLIIPKPPEAIDQKQQLLTSIYGILTRLTDWDVDDERLEKIKRGLQQLAGFEPLMPIQEVSTTVESDDTAPQKPRKFHIKTITRALGLTTKPKPRARADAHASDDAPLEVPHPLEQFEIKLGCCASIGEFERMLDIAVLQIKAPSTSHQQLLSEAMKRYELADITAISNPLLVSYLSGESSLIPQLQEQVLTYLRSPNVLTLEARIESIMPILGYLSGFTALQQSEWGFDYIQNIPLLLAFEAQTLLPALDKVKPMSYQHMKSVCYLARQYASKEATISELIQSVGSTISHAPEQRIRMLTKWESWALRLPTDSAHPFLINFAKGMQHFDDTNWDIFTKLVDKTQAWWNKDGLGQYQDDLMALWSNLGSKTDLKPLNEYILWCLTLPGKSWFSVLSAGLKHLDHTQLPLHFQQLKALWEQDKTSSPALKKQQKIKNFETRCAKLQLVYQLINDSAFTPNEKIAITERLTKLPALQCKALLDSLVESQHPAFKAYPKVVTLMLDYSENKKTAPHLKLLCEVINDFHRANPSDLNALESSLFTDTGQYETVYNKRSILTQLCNRGLLIGPSWTADQNEQLLNTALNQYIQHSESILGKKGEATSVKADPQQTSLLQLTNELAIIAHGPKKDTEGAPAQNDIIGLMKKYKDTWWKSDERSQAINTLQDTMVNMFRDGASYGAILEVIHTTKLTVLTQDLDRNAKRWFYTGQSRLYKTLDKIENRILRHWTQNLDTMQRVDVYHQHFMEHFKQLTEKLGTSLSSTKAQPSNQFFTPAEDKIGQFKSALSDVTNPQRTKQNIQFMRDNLHSLPRHMKSLANQILIKGQHLASYFDKNSPTRTVRWDVP